MFEISIFLKKLEKSKIFKILIQIYNRVSFVKFDIFVDILKKCIFSTTKNEHFFLEKYFSINFFLIFFSVKVSISAFQRA